MIDITLENFDSEVVAASSQIPVLLDFWAPWCGPCKALGPVLEKIETDPAYAGRFVLAKVNSDEQQELSQGFGIRSIPTCVLMVDGKPVNGFQGALPEGQVKAFLDKYLPAAAPAETAADFADEEGMPEPLDTATEMRRLHEALTINPGNDDARYEYVKLLMENHMLDDAEAALAPALAEIPRQIRFDALHWFLNAIQFVATDSRGEWAIDQFDAKIADNKRDFETRFAKARVLMVMGHWVMAMDELLEIIMRDKTWNDAQPRKTYVAILELLTPPQPKPDPSTVGKSAGGIELTGKSATAQDPQIQLISSYRRKLSMALN